LPGLRALAPGPASARSLPGPNGAAPSFDPFAFLCHGGAGATAGGHATLRLAASRTEVPQAELQVIHPH